MQSSCSVRPRHRHTVCIRILNQLFRHVLGARPNEPTWANDSSRIIYKSAATMFRASYPRRT